MGSPPCREDFRRTRQPSRPGHSPDGNQTCARWQQGQDVVERGELSLPQPEAHALLPISGTWPAHRQWFCGGRLQKPHQGPHGTIGHALDRSDGRGHRQAEGHIPQRRLRSVLALPHPKRPGTPASGRQMERRRKVVTPYLKEICFSFAYSDLASLRMGTSGSASFQRVRKSWYLVFAFAESPESW